jgi:hypothetical protein
MELEASSAPDSLPPEADVESVLGRARLHDGGLVPVAVAASAVALTQHDCNREV